MGVAGEAIVLLCSASVDSVGLQEITQTQGLRCLHFLPGRIIPFRPELKAVPCGDLLH